MSALVLIGIFISCSLFRIFRISSLWNRNAYCSNCCALRGWNWYDVLLWTLVFVALYLSYVYWVYVVFHNCRCILTVQIRCMRGLGQTRVAI